MSAPLNPITETPANTRADATAESAANRPWPVVALTALGAWLSLLPLLGVLALLFGDAWRSGIGPYAFGLLMVAGALVVMRSQGLSLFVEQLAWPVLLLGVGAMAFGFVRDLDEAGAAMALAACALALSWLVPQPSLRALLGAATLLLSLFAWLEAGSPANGIPRAAWAVHIAVPGVAALMAMRHRAARAGASPGMLAWSDAALGGAAVAAMASLALWSGTTMMVSAFVGNGAQPGPGMWGESLAIERSWFLWAGLSALAALLAAARLWRAWPAAQRPWWGGVLLAMVGLSAAMPGLGVALAAVALCVLNRRLKLAAWSLAVAVWILGAFYYQLAWPLGTKALVLALAGVALAVLGWIGARQSASRPEAMQPGAPAHRHGAAALLLCAAVALAGVNIGIWQKETLIRDGQPLFVPLAPLDPRSLMQGDYMALAFALPPGLGEYALPAPSGGGRWHVVAVRDARGVAAFRRYDGGSGPLAPGEMRIQLTRKPRGWTLATDAWFFAEGDAERWTHARYGEFRVDAKGTALLVGMRDEALQPIGP